MGKIKDSLKLVNEIVTLGGASRLEEAKRTYTQAYEEYLVLHKQAERYKAEIEENVKAIGIALSNAKAYIEKSEKLIKTSVWEKRTLNANFRMQALNDVARFNSGFSSAIGVGAGSVAGGSLAVGSWALVAALGSASTGTAISGLSGVAAYNATLAWFGGGALAVGGAGMAGGAAVIGGLFAVPVIYFAARGSRKKAREFEEAKAELEDVISQVREQVESYPAVLLAVRGKQHETAKLCKKFVADVINYSEVIRPYGIFSVAKQKFYLIVGKNPYTRKQAEALEQLTQSVTRFLTGLGIFGEASALSEAKNIVA